MPRIVRVLSGFAAAALGVLLLLAALSAGIGLYFNSPPDITAEPVVPVVGIIREEGTSWLVDVRPGESASSVGTRLKNAGIIRSGLFWNLLYQAGREPIKAGLYRLSLPLSQLTIRSILVSGRQLLVKITVPEGATLKKTAAILEAGGVCSGADFLDAAADRQTRERYAVPGPTMEGYLYPDTYLFPRGFSAGEVVATMADTFFNRIYDLDPEARNLSPEKLYERVVIASIVEREYRVSDEAPLMAGVFYNRLRIGMALQSCATVVYIITEIDGKPHPEVLYNRDIALPNSYNTYIHPGLPPGPISAPGAVALRAALQPKSSKYLYFRLVDPAEGRHRFSETLDQHIEAGVLYLKKGATAR